MIVIENFGWRLGNCCLQLMAAIGHAQKIGTEVAFPEWKYAQYFQGDFTPKTCSPKLTYTEDGFHYTEIPVKKNIDFAINGYFQSKKYWEHCDGLIQKMFSPKPEILENLKNRFPGIFEDNSCAVHRRAGDYALHPLNHPMLGVEYYNEAMMVMPEGTRFFVFSDDITWCKKNLKAENIEFVEGTEDWDDFFLQMYCANNITGNSTFSLVPALLNTNKGLKIAPKQWFGSAYSHYDTKDLIPEEGWIKL